MNAYHFFKKFRCGQKAGKISKHPIAKIIAVDEEGAWSAFKEHPKYRKNTSYVIQELGFAGAEEMESGGQKNPGEWSVGDHCWIKLNPWNPDGAYHEGVINRVCEPTEASELEKVRGIKGGPGFFIWILGDYASWRYRRSDEILLQPPKGRRRRRRNRPGRKRRMMSVKPAKTMRRKKSK